MHKRVSVGIIGLLMPLPLLAAPLTNENLVGPLPQGFKAGWSTSHNGMDMTEFVPAVETVGDWTRLITTQIFHGRGDTPSSVFVQGWGKRMTDACPGLTHSQLITGHRNGYAVSFVQANCPGGPQIGKQQFVYLEVFQGRDALYSVQYAFRYQPSPAETSEVLTFLKSLTVCDTRSADHPCPVLASPDWKETKP